MRSSFVRAIIKTLVYADIFDYPLTLAELEKRLIEVQRTKSKVRSTIKNVKEIQEKNGYYFLKGRKENLILREKRAVWSQEKMRRAQRVAFFLRFIPTIQLVGISGALATGNATENDDIDLFIITSSGTLWTTRFVTTLLLDFLFLRRHPKAKAYNDKICLNMFMDEQYLTIVREEQDLFSAYEVVQMHPLFDRGDTHEKFLQANIWVRKYLPNTLMSKKVPSDHTMKKKESRIRLLESVLKNVQLWYMGKRRTREVIGTGILRFHPHDAREWILDRYHAKLRSLAHFL